MSSISLTNHKNVFHFQSVNIDLQSFDCFSVWLREGESRVTLWGNRTVNGKAHSTIIYCDCITTQKADEVVKALVSKNVPQYLAQNCPDDKVPLPHRMTSEIGKKDQRIFEIGEKYINQLSFIDEANRKIGRASVIADDIAHWLQVQSKQKHRSFSLCH